MDLNRCTSPIIDFTSPEGTIEAATKAKRHGNRFFGILGGEPFMHKDLLKIFEANRDVYFQVFTNGHFITDEVAKRLRKCGNVTPLISVEGTEPVSDVRRGREGVLPRTIAGIARGLSRAGALLPVEHA